MQTSRRLIQGIGFSLFAVIVASSCVDEQIVFRDRELFEDPPAAAQGFLGYTDAETKLTVCGNCHVGQQSTWEETGQAEAWAGLQDSGHAQEFCEGCHTVNELGNPAEDTGGYLAFADVRYEDVQCESCHGPGLQHVENPDASMPFASAYGRGRSSTSASGPGSCQFDDPTGITSVRNGSRDSRTAR